MSDKEERSYLVLGAGFLGKYIIHDILRADQTSSVTVIDKVNPDAFFSSTQMREFKNNPKRLRYCWQSCKDIVQLLKDGIIQGTRNGIIITQAIADVPYAIRSVMDTFDANVTSPLSFFELLRAVGYNGRIVLMSSESVYGHQPPDKLPMKEDLLPYPTNVYGASKLCQETIARTYYKQYGLKVTVLRSATMYGAYSRTKQAIPIFIGQVMQSMPVTLEGDGKQSRDFIHVADVAEACELAVEFQGNGIDGETINIGSGNETPFLSLVNAIKYILQQPTDEFDSMGVRKEGYIPIKHLPFRGGEEGLRVVLDNKKAKEKLEWVPTIKFNDGLRHTCAWYASDVLKFEKDEIEELMELMFPNRYTSGLSMEVNKRIYEKQLHKTPGAVVFTEEEFQNYKQNKINRLNQIFRKHNVLEHPQEET